MTACTVTVSFIDRFEKVVKEGNYLEAIELYERAIGNAQEESVAYDFLVQYLNESVNMFASGEIEEAEMNGRILTVERINDSLNIISYELNEAEDSYGELKYSKDCYISAKKYLDNSEYEKAIKMFAFVSSNDTQYYALACEQKADAMAKYKVNMFSKVDEYINDNQYSAAYQLLDSIEILLGYDSDIAIKRSECEQAEIDFEIATYLELAEELINKQEYGEAIRILTEACERYPDMSNLKISLSNCKNKYYDFAVSAAATAFSNGKDYATAIAILEQCKNFIGEWQNIDELIKGYEEYIPVLLADMEYDEKTNYITIGYAYGTLLSDASGNTYSESGIMYPNGGSLRSSYADEEDEGFVEYFLNCKYNELTGTLYLPYVSHAIDSPTVQSMFKVYGDGKLLYEAPTFKKGTFLPVKINVNVSGVSTLKIVMLGIWRENDGWGMFSDDPMICASDLTVSK